MVIIGVGCAARLRVGERVEGVGVDACVYLLCLLTLQHSLIGFPCPPEEVNREDN